MFRYELKDLLQNSSHPIIINICGPGHGIGRIHWDDLQLEENYSGFEAMLQSSRANDLLAVEFVKRDDLKK